MMLRNILSKTGMSVFVFLAGCSFMANAERVIEHSTDDYIAHQYEILSERLHPLSVINGEYRFTVLIPSEYGFETGKAELSRPMRDKLKSLSQFLNHYNDSVIEVYGHTDSVGDFDYNRQLSKKRASVVQEQLLVQGVSPWRTKTIGESYEVPRCSESNAATRECNRRVEIDILLEPKMYRK
ncbi:OmpA family protein [Vibrio mediterranei]|uniref:OmpA family protein n=1 Tax=Vibrio mediterranei TaxID=689 RepID=UPI004068512F